MNTLTLSEYQQLSQSTALYPRHSGFNLAYPVLGLVGEAGEVANEVKKVFRNDNGLLTPERHKKLVDELGDVLWYAAALAVEIGVDLGDVAKGNLLKLQQRKSDNTLLTREVREPQKESDK